MESALDKSVIVELLTQICKQMTDLTKSLCRFATLEDAITRDLKEGSFTRGYCLGHQRMVLRDIEMLKRMIVEYDK
jgi:hypothetical protein